MKTNRILIPPNPPWLPLAICKTSGGYLSYFYSDDLSSLPVRAITRIGDNKVDPNLETKTYGLFSLCNKSMRKSIVNRGCRNIFFVTRRKEERVLTGLYLIKWYTPVTPNGDDFCLAAERIWFIKSPIPLREVDKACRTDVSRPFRTCLRLNINECIRIEKLVKCSPNVTKSYLDEIDRLERFNLKHGGYKCVTSKEKSSYSWHCSTTKLILKKNIRQR